MAATTAVHVTLDCVDLDTQSTFWCAALGYSAGGDSPPYRGLEPPQGVNGPILVLQETGEPKPPGKIRMHFDLVVGDEVESEAKRLVDLGATQITDIVGDEAGHWIVLADPEGNEFCVVNV